MKKKIQTQETKYVSAEKIQEYLLELSEAFSGCKRVRAQKCEDGIKLISSKGYMQVRIVKEGGAI